MRASSSPGRARSSTSWRSFSASTRLTARRVCAKNGSEKTRSSGSGTTTATDPVRRVTKLRAAGLGE